MEYGDERGPKMRESARSSSTPSQETRLRGSSGFNLRQRKTPDPLVVVERARRQAQEKLELFFGEVPAEDLGGAAPRTARVISSFYKQSFAMTSAII